MIEQLQRQIFRDHLLRCRQRLADARTAVAGKSGFELGNAILMMHERQSEFRRALDLMWEAQGRENEVPATWNVDSRVDDLLVRYYQELPHAQ